MKSQDVQCCEWVLGMVIYCCLVGTLPHDNWLMIRNSLIWCMFNDMLMDLLLTLTIYSVGAPENTADSGMNLQIYFDNKSFLLLLALLFLLLLHFSALMFYVKHITLYCPKKEKKKHHIILSYGNMHVVCMQSQCTFCCQSRSHIVVLLCTQ